MAFTKLKQQMANTPKHQLPHLDQPFYVEIDVSTIVIGAVLQQDGKPLAFFSKRMCPRMQQAPAYVRELFAITEVVKKWRQYLVGRKFQIFTNHNSLKHLMTQTIQTPE